MYISHAADSKEAVCGSEMSSFEGSGFRSEVFVTGWEFEGL